MSTAAFAASFKIDRSCSLNAASASSFPKTTTADVPKATLVATDVGFLCSPAAARAGSTNPSIGVLLASASDFGDV
jgi:hypothetical protein